MSNRSIVITEKQIVDAMDEMCHESLCPEYHDAWEEILQMGLGSFEFDW